MYDIKHYPKGETPYSKSGHERIPYLPSEGENVKVYAILKGNAEGAYLLIDNKKIYPETENTKDGETYVMFELGSFSDGQKVSYQIFTADSKTKVFSFTVGRWTDIIPSEISLADNNIRFKNSANFGDLFIGFADGNIILSKNICGKDKIASDNKRFVSSNISVEIKNNPFSFDVFADGNLLISDVKLSAFGTDKVEKVKMCFDSDNQGIFGLGERFDGANQVNKQPKNVVFEKFTQQGEITYFPIPFFYSTAGYGLFADTNAHIDYDFDERSASMTMELFDDIYIMPKSLDETIKGYTRLTGECTLPPKWSFGPWISANRWNSQKHIDEQVEYIKKHNYPTNALVIEAWSDEATFYVFNDSVYEPKKGFLSADEITYKEDGLWPDPKKMIDELHEMGIKVILWQAPMIKLLEEGRQNKQHEIDRQEVVEQNLVIKNADGSPYTIPYWYWFRGSYVPDFSNPEMCRWAAGKRKYLMDMGVDGFKTDGGEFIYHDDLRAYNDTQGKQIRNDYMYQYEKAYNDMLNDDGVLFSRAGYKGVQQFPIHWAGDQQSLYSEFRAVIKAGLSLGLSGVPFWSFDIGGFANKLPSTELYLRWTSMAVFAPIFQWHSEPTFGQFADVIKGDGGINDRSPWNMADYHKENEVLQLSTYFANMRMNLLPYIYQVAEDCALNSKPMFKHLYYENPDDANTINIEDEFMLGDLLIAPIVNEGDDQRTVYLGDGKWENIFTGDRFNGKISISQACNVDEISVFIKQGCGMMLNLDDDFELGTSVGNDVDSFVNPCVYIAGDKGEYSYSGAGVECNVSWIDGKVDVVNSSEKDVVILSSNDINNMNQIGTTKFKQNVLKIYLKRKG